MILLTPELRERLLANGGQIDADHVPVIKLFNPLGEGVWPATELNADGDTLFGLADLGDPELGSFSLAEIAAVRLPFGLGIERIVARTDEDRSEFLRRRGFSKAETGEIIDTVLAEEGRPPESVFDFVQGITAAARDKLHQDARLDLETRAKKLLDRATCG